MKLTARAIVVATLGASALGLAAVVAEGTAPAGARPDTLQAVRRSSTNGDDRAETFATRTVPPLAALREIASRPLFSPTRRPPEPAPAPVAVAVAAAPKRIETGQYRLVGVVQPEGGVPLAILRSARGNKLYRAGGGDQVEDWTVVSIKPTEVTLRQGTVDDVLLLKDNEPGPGVVRAPMPPPHPQRVAPGVQGRRAGPVLRPPFLARPPAQANRRGIGLPGAR